MRTPRRIRLLLLAALPSLIAALLTLSHAPWPVSADEGGIFLPVGVNRFAGPFEPARTAMPPSATIVPEATRTPTDLPPGTPVPPGTPSATLGAGPTPTPTLPGTAVEYDTDAKTIVLQIGVTDTDEQGAVWEEMNGTPMVTIYGDGRVIGAHMLHPNLDQNLFEGRVSDYTLQLWLRALVHEVGFYTMKDDYQHSQGSKPEVHVWLNTKAADKGKRVSLRGFYTFERRGARDYPADEAKIKALVEVVRSIEAAVQGTGDGGATVPYTPECFTILAQKTQGFLSNPPTWEGDVNPVAIAMAAPTAASNYIDKVVGHKFVDTATGLEVQRLVVPAAMEWFPIFKRAAEFDAGGRPHGVGARREVPGGSMFLPQMPNAGGWAGGVDIRRSYWYRRDAGSGSCASLPGRPLASDEIAGGSLWQLIRALRSERAQQLNTFNQLRQLLPAGSAASPAP
jgi:hypothetical protein